MPEKGTSRREGTSWERVWGIPLLHWLFGGIVGAIVGAWGVALKQSLWCFFEWKYCSLCNWKYCVSLCECIHVISPDFGGSSRFGAFPPGLNLGRRNLPTRAFSNVIFLGTFLNKTQQYKRMKCDFNSLESSNITFPIINDSVTMAETMIIGAERKNKIRA